MKLLKLAGYALDEFNIGDTDYMEDPPAPKAKDKGKKKSKKKDSEAQDAALFSCALDSIGVSDDKDKPKYDGKMKTFKFTFEIDASKYAKRFGINIPDDSSDAVLTDGENGKNDGEAKASDKVVTDSAAMDASVSFADGVKATIEECRARNPMTCRFHGSQALANHIQGLIRNAGLDGDVNVNFRGVRHSGGKNWIQAEVEVTCPNTESNVAKLDRAMAEFAGDDGAVTGIDYMRESAGEGENGRISAPVDLDIDKLDENARGRWHLVEPEVQAQVAQATGVPRREVAEAVENAQEQVAQAEQAVGTVSPELTRAREELTFAQQMLENAPENMRPAIQQMVDAAQARVDALMPQDSPELVQAREELAFAQQMLENAPAGMRAAVQQMVDAAQARVDALSRRPEPTVQPETNQTAEQPNRAEQPATAPEAAEEEEDPNNWENMNSNTRAYWEARYAADNGDIGDITDDQLEHARNVLGEDDPLFRDILSLYNMNHNTHVTPDGVSAHAGETDPRPGDGRTEAEETPQQEEQPAAPVQANNVDPEAVTQAENQELSEEPVRVDQPYDSASDTREGAMDEISDDDKQALIDEYNRAKSEMNACLRSLSDRGVLRAATNRDGSPKLDENGNQIMEPDVSNREDADAMKFRRWSSYRAAIGDVIGKYSRTTKKVAQRDENGRIVRGPDGKAIKVDREVVTEAGNKIGDFANRGEIMKRAQDVIKSNLATMLEHPERSTAFKRSINMAKFLGSKLGANVSVDPTNGNMSVDWTDNPTPVNTNFDYIGAREGRQASGMSATPTQRTPQNRLAVNGGTASSDGTAVTSQDTAQAASPNRPTQDAISDIARGASNFQDRQADGGGISFTLPGDTPQAEIDRIVADLQRQYGDGYEVTATRDGQVSMRRSVNTSSASSLFNGIRETGLHVPSGMTFRGSNGTFDIGGGLASREAADDFVSSLATRLPNSTITPVQNPDGSWTIRVAPRRQQAERAEETTPAPEPTVTLTAPTLQTQEARDLGAALGGAVREELNRAAQATEQANPVPSQSRNQETPRQQAPRQQASDSAISQHINDALDRLVQHWGGGADRILRGIHDALEGRNNPDVDTYLDEAEGVLGRTNPVMQAIRNRTTNPAPAPTPAPRAQAQQTPAPAAPQATPAQPATPAQATTTRPATGTMTAERARQVNTNLTQAMNNVRNERARGILSRIQANARRVAGL